VLNLAENRIDVGGLVALAEALVRFGTDVADNRNTTRRWRLWISVTTHVAALVWKG
jgi:hypothetical protein